MTMLQWRKDTQGCYTAATDQCRYSVHRRHARSWLLFSHPVEGGQDNALLYSLQEAKLLAEDHARGGGTGRL